MQITALNKYEIDKIYKFANLKEKERMFFDMRNDEMTIAEIAEAMDMSESGVKKLAKKVYAKCTRTLLNG